MRDKPKLAVFKFTGCAGCQLELLHLEDRFIDLLGLIDISYWVMAKRDNSEGPFDISLVEGSVSTPREIQEIKEIRLKSKALVAYGDCAIGGCIPSIKNWMTEAVAEETVYPDTSVIQSITVHGISEYVKVDARLPGCPPSRETLLELLKGLLSGKKPLLRPHCVCVECKLKENGCLLTERNMACMGPVTVAGCGAICPSVGRECEGCYGPMKDANARALAQTFEEMGLSKPDIILKFRKYAGTAPEFFKEAGI